MRERSTWHKKSDETPRQAATSRKADPYTMNQEHPQPGATDYESGSPESWGESPVPGDKMSVNEEYDGDHVKRNELGFPEFREDTWKHKDSEKWNDGKKYDNAKLAAERKAMAAERVARFMLRTSNEKLVEETAIDLMALPPRALAATLKRIQLASPDSLSEESKYKRAYACTKLAAHVLGDGAKEEHVETLASSFMSIDDPTLKSILKTVAVGRVAQEEEQQEAAKGKVGQEEQQEEQASPAAPVAQEQQEEQQAPPVAQQQEQSQECMSQQEQQALSPEEMAMLDSMLHEEMAEHAEPCALPAAPAGDSLTDLFEAAPAPAPMAPMMAAGKPVAVDISFDESDEVEAPEAAAHIATLDDLFSDEPEVVAQRQIASANAEALGFSRTASVKGAKKLGNVKAASTKTEGDKLEALWDRP